VARLAGKTHSPGPRDGERHIVATE
jgi:hypothetical protein